ncbi:MAG: DUF1343 domain-containing protein [Deltaproteobacteria bacterium]|jgi:uncharacterized protein YbbC (DUF1343 family)|nr:DUF1343 domain-containing protein [Deltaproteobacteria bacterium]
MARSVIPGIERLADEHARLVRGRRVGLVAHPASVDRRLRHSLDVLRDAGAKVEVLFGPEHGFGGEAQDMEPVAGGTTGPHGIPLHSLYGADEDSLAPAVADLAGLDALVVDLADVGARYYTFVWTAALCLRACHRAGVELLLADRPNPLGGESVEGAPQGEGYLSFVGLYPVSNRHGMTPGELVRLAASRDGTGDALTVVEMRGWQRGMSFADTGLPWVLPSPNMPTDVTALVYPGGCLLEGTWASEGRGTTRPFELFGAPGVDGGTLATRLEEMRLPGARFRACSFKPGFQKHVGRHRGGAQLHVTDPRAFRPYLTGVALLLALRAEAGERFAWREQPYEFVTDRPAIDLLTGGDDVRRGLEAGASLPDLAGTWAEGEEVFIQSRRDFLLY